MFCSKSHKTTHPVWWSSKPMQWLMWKALKPEAGVSLSIVTSAPFKRPPCSAALNTSGFQIFLLSLLLLLLLPPSAPGSPAPPPPLYPNPPPLPTFLILLPILSLCIHREKSFKWKHQNINKIDAKRSYCHLDEEYILFHFGSFKWFGNASCLSTLSTTHPRIRNLWFPNSSTEELNTSPPLWLSRTSSLYWFFKFSAIFNFCPFFILPISEMVKFFLTRLIELNWRSTWVKSTLSIHALNVPPNRINPSTPKEILLKYISICN